MRRIRVCMVLRLTSSLPEEVLPVLSQSHLSLSRIRVIESPFSCMNVVTARQASLDYLALHMFARMSPCGK